MGAKPTIAVIGAGITGLTAAYRLLQQGYAVALYEAEAAPGGLAKTISIAGSPLEIYYHHYFSSDEYFFSLCRELGIGDAIRLLPARMGYVSGGTPYDFGTPQSLFTFTPLSFPDKFRCALSALAMGREKSLEKMDQCTAEDWITAHAGKRVYEIIWKPLLIQKFGKRYQTIPMAWIWRKVHIRSLSKRNVFAGEKLAYLRGSIDVFINALKDRILNQGGQIYCNSAVRQIKKGTDGRFSVTAPAGTADVDAVLSTIPAETLRGMAEFGGNFDKRLFSLEYLGVVCVMLELANPLTDYYWLNVGDNSFPFGLVVEHTNFCPAADYGNRHVLYLSKYCQRDERIFSGFTDAEVADYFVQQLKRLRPGFSVEDIEQSHVFRAACAQPVIERPYLPRKPDYTTSFANFYWVSPHHIYPDDRGVNYAVKMADDVVRFITQNRKQQE